MSQAPPSDDAFYAQLGRALDAWATLELVLSWWFRYLTAMTPGMARAVFYSSNSFSTKRDMLDAALEQAQVGWFRLPEYRQAVPEIKPAPAEVIDFLKVAFRKANTYSTARNSLAHRLTNVDDSTNIYTLVDRGGYPNASGISKAQMAEIETSIVSLKDILRNVHTFVTTPEKTGLPQTSPQEGLLRAHGLPKQAYSLPAAPNSST